MHKTVVFLYDILLYHVVTYYGTCLTALSVLYLPQDDVNRVKHRQ